MQQENELRLGNLVKNSDGIICPVTQLGTNELGINISVRSNSDNSKYGGMVEELSPINLTTEILSILGFEVQKIGTPFRNIYIMNGLTLNNNFQLCNHDGTITINDRRIQFLHQLQNLYLLLIGHELEIDKNKIT